MGLLQGRVDVRKASMEDQELLRLLTPLGKLYTAKLCSAGLAECSECLGGAGYMEDATPLPAAIRDQMVNCIWEGTTNVLALDLLRALARHPRAFVEYHKRVTQTLQSPLLTAAFKPTTTIIKVALNKISEFVDRISKNTTDFAESVARDLAFAMASVFIAILLVEQALWPGGSKAGREDSVDLRVAQIWCERHVLKETNNLADETELERRITREIALDTDSSGRDRGHGDVCPITGRVRARV